METLAACAPVYGPQALLSNIGDIFNYLKLEVFHSTEIALEDVAVESIRSVVATLGTGTSSTDFDPTQKALKSLVEECATNLKDPDMKDSKQTGRILRAVASAAGNSISVVIH
jgi:DNA repair/transcription protein MET18/MMS19